MPSPNNPPKAAPPSRIALSLAKARQPFQHPLLALLSSPGSRLPEPWRGMQRSLRTARNVRLGAGARAAAAIELLESMQENEHIFGVEGPAAALELLSALQAQFDSIEIMERLTLAQLHEAGLRLGELPAVRPGPGLVSLEPLPGTSGERRLDKAYLGAVRVTLTKALEHLMSRAPRGFPSFAASECFSGVRVLQLILALPLGGAPLGTPVGRLQFFDGLGLDMWNALIRRARKLGAPIEPGEVRYGPQAQFAWLHHLRGQLTASVMPAPWDKEDIEPGRQAASHVVVTAAIPPATDRVDRELLPRYELLRQPLPVARLPELPELEDVERRLSAEFPWALDAVRALVGDLRVRRQFGAIEMGLAPTLLVGPPGCGKSRLARRLSELLQLPFRAIPCGGAHDAKPLLGTARGWASGQPSPLIDLLLASRSASALVVLDEIDKVTSYSGSGGSMREAALGLLEPENARAWVDSYLQAPCDLTRLMFVATANRLDPLPRPLLSRLRLIYVAPPQGCHASAIAAGVTRDLEREWGLPAGTLPELTYEVGEAREVSARELRASVGRRLQDWAEEHLRPGKMH